jgi:hypothetical protein
VDGLHGPGPSDRSIAGGRSASGRGE